MTDLFLGVIALAVLVMAAIQVAAIVFAARAARRVRDAVDRLEQNVQPIMANLQVMTSEAARASSAAAAQVQRAEQLIGEAFGTVQGIVAALASLGKGSGREASRKRPAAAEEEDVLFIG